jgi:MAS20 protein import receptor
MKRHVYYMCTCRLRVFVLPHPTNSFLGKEMAPTKTLAALAVSGIGILAYAIYFDYRRRTDANFRKQLRMLVLLVTLVHSSYGLARTGKEET